MGHDPDEERLCRDVSTRFTHASHGPTVAVNRPYLYIIRDRGAGAILFIGRVIDPSITP
jgi:serine protease inhibitor